MTIRFFFVVFFLFVLFVFFCCFFFGGGRFFVLFFGHKFFYLIYYVRFLCEGRSKITQYVLYLYSCLANSSKIKGYIELAINVYINL